MTYFKTSQNFHGLFEEKYEKYISIQVSILAEIRTE